MYVYEGEQKKSELMVANDALSARWLHWIVTIPAFMQTLHLRKEACTYILLMLTLHFSKGSIVTYVYFDNKFLPLDNNQVLSI